jgi:shikimate kinase / 3-dehydroquinate synthase
VLTFARNLCYGEEECGHDPLRFWMSGVNKIATDKSGEALRATRVREALQGRSVVLIGMMGAGKSSIGRRLAQRLALNFSDADNAIESAAGMSITEIFAQHGEEEFRKGERRVIARLLNDEQMVIATGGGAFQAEETRQRIAEKAVSVWLKADVDILLRRVRKRTNRPMLHTQDPEATLKRLLDDRGPNYAKADLSIQSRDVPHDIIVDELLLELERHLLSPDMPSEQDAAKLQTAKVKVGLGDRAYFIDIGPQQLAQAGDKIHHVLPHAACMIVTDNHVAALHLGTLQQSLDQAGLRHHHIVVPAGEKSKSYAWFETVCDAIIAAKIERGDCVIALGGGVIGDLAGFAAASVRRGVQFIQIPTSLLAMVDSSVGGKTGINSKHGKNLIGAFYQPRLVLADTDVLDTLSEREFRAGYAEVVKYGLINDVGFFNQLEKNWREIFSGGPARLQAIETSCKAKAAIVARDEREDGERALLNLGHTFAHAFERLVDYDGARLVHGEAVSIGLVAGFRFSVALGHCSGQDAMRVSQHLKQVGLPTEIRDIPGFKATSDDILEAMAQDKKVSRGQLTFILTRAIGESFIARGIASSDVRSYLDSAMTQAP